MAINLLLLIIMEFISNYAADLKINTEHEYQKFWFFVFHRNSHDLESHLSDVTTGGRNCCKLEENMS